MQQFELNGLPLLRFSHLPNDRLIQLTTTISGGVSVGNYASFNLGEYCGDEPANVITNKSNLAQALNIKPPQIIVPHQTHSDNVLVIDKSFLQLSKEEQKDRTENIDALITDLKHVFIGITTADCVPVFLFDHSKNIIATIHAGWKGTVERIAKKTAQTMINTLGSNPNDLIAGIGPSISPELFEVGDEVGKTFQSKGFNLPEISFRNKETNKLHVDLWKANYIQLIEIGIPSINIEIAKLCTYSNPNLFFSARRQSIHSGRMITGGMLL